MAMMEAELFLLRAVLGGYEALLLAEDTSQSFAILSQRLFALLTAGSSLLILNEYEVEQSHSHAVAPVGKDMDGASATTSADQQLPLHSSVDDELLRRRRTFGRLCFDSLLVLRSIETASVPNTSAAAVAHASNTILLRRCCQMVALHAKLDSAFMAGRAASKAAVMTHATPAKRNSKEPQQSSVGSGATAKAAKASGTQSVAAASHDASSTGGGIPARTSPVLVLDTVYALVLLQQMLQVGSAPSAVLQRNAVYAALVSTITTSEPLLTGLVQRILWSLAAEESGKQ
jgi:hypothetical protein